ncbi:hypothetical protein JOC95_000955 [Bacillus tianshenii]|uniref:Uncharacterized protein n=1 Tax=Sutcliffiella tianshenii TaxID=1463404 RepID=A0ABS2NWR2_9BACI|nr:hypothetical protein [Bacillus tianshenii]MBM7619106.1 hypothetical protein [Bacillus tianshenii]
MKNKVGALLKVIGFGIIIIGFIWTIVVISETESFGLGAPLFFQMFLYGMAFIGFGEVINLLQSILNKMKPAGNDQVVGEKKSLPQNIDYSETTGSAEAEIREFYAKRNRNVQEIKPTPFQDFYIVHVDGITVLVELGGFSPEVYASNNWPAEIKTWHEENFKN